MAVSYGYDPARDTWSRDATERLLSPIFRADFSATKLVYQWQTEMDLGYGVDGLMSTPGRNYSLAIRVRGRQFRRFQDVTFRYESLQTMNKRLEFEKTIATHMAYAYADTDFPTPARELIEWQFIKVQVLVEMWRDKAIEWDTRPTDNHDGSSRLIAFKFSTLARHGLIVAGFVSPNVSALFTPHKKPMVSERQVLPAPLKPATVRMPGF